VSLQGWRWVVQSLVGAALGATPAANAAQALA
jgi:hypothetical protein